MESAMPIIHGMHPHPSSLGGGGGEVKIFRKVFAGGGVRNFYFGRGYIARGKGNFVGGVTYF